MNAFDIAGEQAAALADGFAAHVARWAAGLGADAATVRAVAAAAAQASLATGEGHVCVALDAVALALGEPVEALRARLLGSGVVGTPAAPGSMPLVLDDDGRLYLQRDFDHERRLARRLLQAARARPLALADATRARLDMLFAGNAAALGGATDWQKAAAALALERRLAVISGGPGTGKTTTVVNLLACLAADEPGCRIALAAPTGKAATRLTEAIRARSADLPAAIRERLPGEAFTVHRLLGVTPRGFAHHAGRPLAIDALVVDEASMLDLALAARLLDAVPSGARIVLLGDKDQLAAVESGAVFAELAGRPAPLADAVVWFTHNFRFGAGSAIGRLAADINAGRAAAALDGLRAGGDARWIDDAGAAPAPETWRCIEDGLAPYLATVLRDPSDPGAVTEAFGTFRVLCAVHEGPRGMLAVDAHASRHARAVLAPLAARHVVAGSDWYPGRPVMVLRNDPVQRLYNGDIGIALPDAAGELKVFFPDAGGGFRAVAPLRLPEHRSAFAMTVHKSQGSEFDDVLVLLPAERSRVLTRELLYTAVTRARRSVTLAGGAPVVEAAIAAPTQRVSGLLARLRDEA